MTGSKPAGPLAAAWAIIEALGEPGLRRAHRRAARGDRRAARRASTAIEGLRVVGEPVGPLLAVATDDSVPAERRVDPHHWADAARASGWHLQLQPGLTQADGTRLPHTTHLTVTPVTEAVLPELTAALDEAADAVRGVPPVDGARRGRGPCGVHCRGAPMRSRRRPSWGSTPRARPDCCGQRGCSAATPERRRRRRARCPTRMAPVLALVEALPGPLTERLLVELLARVVEPPRR